MGTAPSDWLYLAWAVLGLLIASFGIKQMSFVIVNGSVFDWIRNGFKRGMRSGMLGAETLHALFTCTLCMTTQLSLWLVGLPAFVIILLFGPALGLPLPQNDQFWTVLASLAYAGFLAFGVGGLATVFMTATEYPPSRYRKLYDEHQALRHRSEILEALVGGASVSVSGVAIALADLVLLFDTIDTQCQGIHCSFRRADCLMTTYEAVINQWTQERNLTKTQNQLLLGSFGPLVSEYYGHMWDFEGKPERRLAFIHELHKQLMVPEAA